MDLESLKHKNENGFEFADGKLFYDLQSTTAKRQAELLNAMLNYQPLLYGKTKEIIFKVNSERLHKDVYNVLYYLLREFETLFMGVLL